MVMAMGRRKAKQQELWVSTQEIARPASHPFYEKVNQVLEEQKFDRKVEHLCQRYYKPVMGRPSVAPGVYFRMLLLAREATLARNSSGAPAIARCFGSENGRWCYDRSFRPTAASSSNPDAIAASVDGSGTVTSPTKSSDQDVRLPTSPHYTCR